MLAAIHEWFLGLGAAYGVNPYIFGAIYVGAIPLFVASVTWMVRRLRAERPVTLQVLLAGFFFLSAYLYLLAVGRNLAWWVYALIAALLLYGVVSTVRSVRSKARAAEFPGES